MKRMKNVKAGRMKKYAMPFRRQPRRSLSRQSVTGPERTLSVMDPPVSIGYRRTGTCRLTGRSSTGEKWMLNGLERPRHSRKSRRFSS